MEIIESVQVQKFKDIYMNNINYIDAAMQLEHNQCDKNIVYYIERLSGYKIYDITPVTLSKLLPIMEHIIYLEVKAMYIGYNNPNMFNYNLLKVKGMDVYLQLPESSDELAKIREKALDKFIPNVWSNGRCFDKPATFEYILPCDKKQKLVMNLGSLVKKDKIAFADSYLEMNIPVVIISEYVVFENIFDTYDYFVENFSNIMDDLCKNIVNPNIRDRIKSEVRLLSVKHCGKIRYTSIDVYDKCVASNHRYIRSDNFMDKSMTADEKIEMDNLNYKDELIAKLKKLGGLPEIQIQAPIQQIEAPIQPIANEPKTLSKTVLKEHNKYFKKKSVAIYILKNKPANNTKANDYYDAYLNTDRDDPASKVVISKILRFIHTDLSTKHSNGVRYMIDSKKISDSLENAKKYLESIMPSTLDDKFDLKSEANVQPKNSKSPIIQPITSKYSESSSNSDEDSESTDESSNTFDHNNFEVDCFDDDECDI